MLTLKASTDNLNAVKKLLRDNETIKIEYETRLAGYQGKIQRLETDLQFQIQELKELKVHKRAPCRATPVDESLTFESLVSVSCEQSLAHNLHTVSSGRQRKRKRASLASIWSPNQTQDATVHKDQAESPGSPTEPMNSISLSPRSMAKLLIKN